MSLAELIIEQTNLQETEVKLKLSCCQTLNLRYGRILEFRQLQKKATRQLTRKLQIVRKPCLGGNTNNTPYSKVKKVAPGLKYIYIHLVLNILQVYCFLFFTLLHKPHCIGVFVRGKCLYHRSATSVNK